MDDPTRMKHALASILPEGAATPDPDEDLARARQALGERSRRRFRTGLAALAIVVVSGVGAVGAFERATQPDPATPSPRASSIELLASTFRATPYSFDLTPQGWSVQSQSAYAVTIVPDDRPTSPDPDVFIGKLVITLDRNPLGRQLVGGPGRPVSIHGDSGYTTLSMRTSAGEPVGVVRIQYPDDAGWTRAAMVRFVRSVHVGAGAKPSLG